MNLYEELELPKNCSPEQIKQQYRHMAGIHHPDKGGDAEKFKRIKLAYEVLSDPSRRKTYDETNVISESNGIRNEALNTLSLVFFKVISSIDLHNGNLVEAMKTEIAGGNAKLDADAANCKKYILNLELAKQKLIFKNPVDENILLGFLETQLSARQNDLRVIAHQREVNDLMLILLEDYMYGFLELPTHIPDVVNDEGNPNP
jgi:curved DNA-binding protein CbpA